MSVKQFSMEYPYLEGLNKAQHDAVVNTEGPSLVIAGAGSGKTRVLTFRIAHLLRQGVPPYSILALTFTNKAAREMKERIGSVVGKEAARYLWMGTFHSIFARILRVEAENIGFPSSFTIYDTSDAKSLLRSIIKDMQLSDKVYKPNIILGRISAAKNNLITAEAYATNPGAQEYDRNHRMPKVAAIYKEYTRRCKVSGAMDFDDLLMHTNQLLHKHPEVAAKYQDRFRYVLVDEYQDTNFSQYLIVKKLAEKFKNICVVGDDAQSIYSFRGARIENILNFRNDYPGYKTFKLEQNYRSTQNIVNAANSIIQQNKRQLKKEVFSENDEGDKIKVLQAISDTEEGIKVINELNQHRLTVHDKFADYAILYRTNAQSRIFEENLRKQNLPYKIYGGLSFYERKEIKDMLGYLRLIANSQDNEALKRVINYPARGIGATTISKLETAANGSGISIWQVVNSPLEYGVQINKGTIAKISGFVELIHSFKKQLADSSAYEIALSVARQTKILDELYRDKTPENLSKFENVQELLNAIQDFSINAKEEGSSATLETYLQDIALLTDQDTDTEEDRNKVTLMTVHSAKGLEFKNVFIVGVEDKLFPSSFSGMLTPENLEEERRLFYVAITRAMNKLWVSFAKQRYNWGNLVYSEPSRFISELDERYVDFPTGSESSSFMGAAGINAGTDKIRNSTFGTGERKPLTRKPVQQVTQQMNRRLTSLQKATGRPSFEADDPSKIKEGCEVEHQRFGRGKVLSIEGDTGNLKATVLFQSAGRKQLLLKFARLRVL